MKQSFETLQLKYEDKVTTVTLNRPELHNAFNEIMIAELRQAFAALAKDAQVRVIVLTGAGESFCAGADLNWMKKVATYTAQQNKADALKLHRMLLAIQRCPKPVIAHVHGAALGGGAGLVAAVDIAVAEVGSTFGFTEVRLGLIPAVISPFVLRKIGTAQAREFFLTGERFSAAQAKEIGLIQHCGDASFVAEKLQHKIQQLKQAAPTAIAVCKNLLEKINGQALDKVGAFTAGEIAKRRASAEGKEGMLAFLNKKKPGWSA